MIINFERAIGLYNEEAVQRLFLESHLVMKAFNVYYGTAHFLVTAGVLMWLFVRHPLRYTRWRWALASTTLLALVGFLAFPLMPPRLLTSAFNVGEYVDTLHTIGGLWNFEEGAIAKLSNQYAAMPSLHFAWSLWCLLALWPCLRRWWTRVLAVLHPAITLVAIVATANHYWLDAAGGAVALLAGWLLGGVLGAGAVSRVGTWPRLPTRLRAGAGGMGKEAHGPDDPASDPAATETISRDEAPPIAAPATAEVPDRSDAPRVTAPASAEAPDRGDAPQVTVPVAAEAPDRSDARHVTAPVTADPPDHDEAAHVTAPASADIPDRDSTRPRTSPPR